MPLAGEDVGDLVVEHTAARNRLIDESNARRGQSYRSPMSLTSFLHIGETDCVAGHIGFELRCAK
jgi:hypothetical protein